MIYINSSKNEQIKKIKKLRQEECFYWWEGFKFFNEILKEKKTIYQLVLTEKNYNVLKDEINNIHVEKIYLVTDEVFKKISFTVTPQGIGGILKKKTYKLSEICSEKKPIFFLDGLQDPGNVGTIVRVADAFNFAGIIYRNNGVSPYHEKAVRSSVGSILRVPCYCIDDKELHKFIKTNRPLFFLEPNSDDSYNIKQVDREELRWGVFFLGKEGSGLEIKIAGAKKIYIPMKNSVDSLNVAITAGIVGFLVGELY